jgi:death on curing protein
MSRWIWVRDDTARAIHSEQLREHGGGRRVRSLNQLRTVLARPNHAPDVAALAASYAFGIARNHPFIDGNKRTAYVVCELFLALNGYALTASDGDAVMTILALAAGELSEEQLADWIRRTIVAA